MDRMLQMALERQREIEAAVLPLCEAHGFGAVMQAAADQWARRDPHGALTVGPPKLNT